ncbi:MAG: hypothetical protein E7038_04175 [Lentisphaerae bacterium]|nr:hypothetical protein [Lentisphaerota bacterium]
MHRYFPFDNVTIDGLTIPENELVAGTMRFASSGNDTAVTTADGKTHFIRRTIRREAEFDVFGNRNDLCKLKPVSAVFQRCGSVFITFQKALVRTEYNAERHSTRVTVYEVSFP